MAISSSYHVQIVNGWFLFSDVHFDIVRTEKPIWYSAVWFFTYDLVQRIFYAEDQSKPSVIYVQVIYFMTENLI